jgi:hypothetical protein
VIASDTIGDTKGAGHAGRIRTHVRSCIASIAGVVGGAINAPGYHVVAEWAFTIPDNVACV